MTVDDVRAPDHPGQGEGLAAEALKTRDLVFSRWCA